MAFDERGVHAVLGKEEGGGQADEAAADDEYLGAFHLVGSTPREQPFELAAQVVVESWWAHDHAEKGVDDQ